MREIYDMLNKCYLFFQNYPLGTHAKRRPIKNRTPVDLKHA